MQELKITATVRIIITGNDRVFTSYKNKTLVSNISSISNTSGFFSHCCSISFCICFTRNNQTEYQVIDKNDNSRVISTCNVFFLNYTNRYWRTRHLHESYFFSGKCLKKWFINKRVIVLFLFLNKSVLCFCLASVCFLLL